MGSLKTPSKRLPAAALVFAAIAGLMAAEGFAPKAMKPVPADRWTYGYGSTYKADGAPVKQGDTITKDDGRKLLEIKVRDVYQKKIHECAGDIPMTQGEHDVLVDLGYNIGAEKVCSYSIIQKFRAGDYAAGCQSIFTIDMLNGKHCRFPENLASVPGCKGIMNRRQKQYDLCVRDSQ